MIGKGAWYVTLNICLLASRPRPIKTTWVAALLLHYFSLGDTWRDCSEHPCCSQVSSACFAGGSYQYIMVGLGHACLSCPRISLARLLSTFRGAIWRAEFFEELLGLPKALVELNTIDFTALTLHLDHQNFCVGQKSCLTSVPLLFECKLYLVLSFR